MLSLVGGLLGLVPGDSAAQTPNLLASVLLLLDLLATSLFLLLQSILQWGREGREGGGGFTHKDTKEGKETDSKTAPDGI